eukprot:gene7105-51696_t
MDNLYACFGVYPWKDEWSVWRIEQSGQGDGSIGDHIRYLPTGNSGELDEWVMPAGSGAWRCVGRATELFFDAAQRSLVDQLGTGGVLPGAGLIGGEGGGLLPRLAAVADDAGLAGRGLRRRADSHVRFDQQRRPSVGDLCADAAERCEVAARRGAEWLAAEWRGGRVPLDAFGRVFPSAPSGGCSPRRLRAGVPLDAFGRVFKAPYALAAAGLHGAAEEVVDACVRTFRVSPARFAADPSRKGDGPPPRSFAALMQ